MRARAILLLFAACLFGGCVRDLSGLTLDGQGRVLAVNNRPGVVLRGTLHGDTLDLHPLPFRLSTLMRYDLEGIAYVDDDLFYVVSEKEDNACVGGCTLAQDVIPLRLDEDGYVAPSRCARLRLPLFADDDPACAFANCGLEGVAFDGERNLLYVAKEAFKPRLFAVQLDDSHCPTGNFVELHPPLAYPGYNDLAYSAARHSLFILSTRAHAFYEWRLDVDRIGLQSRDMPEAAAFLARTPVVEGLALDDKNHQLLLLAESGAFARFPLPY